VDDPQDPPNRIRPVKAENGSVVTSRSGTFCLHREPGRRASCPATQPVGYDGSSLRCLWIALPCLNEVSESRAVI
jgi:hypothetical protein